VVAEPKLDAADAYKPRPDSPALDAKLIGPPEAAFDAGGCARPAMIGARPPCPR
jgi:hypothetical protein